MDTQFDNGTFTDLHHLLFDLFPGLFDDLFDPGGVDTAVRDQTLKGKPGDLPAKGVKGGKHDGFRGVIHDEIDTGCRLDGPDIAAFPADDLTLYFVAFKVENGDGIFDRLFGGGTLDTLDDDLPGLLVRLLFGVVDDLLLEGEGPALGLLAQAFHQLGF